MSKQDLKHIFTYHRPAVDDVGKYYMLREAGLAFASVIQLNVPEGADQEDAIRKVREAVMTANAGIALGGRLHPKSNPFPPEPLA